MSDPAAAFAVETILATIIESTGGILTIPVELLARTAQDTVGKGIQIQYDEITELLVLSIEDIDKE